jgi:uncharacterized protein (TIGR03435 family)
MSEFDTMLKYLLTAPAISAVLFGFVAAQTAAPPAFEAASIKPDDSGGNYVELKPGSLNAHSATPATCVMWAYGVQSSQVAGANSGVSGLLESARYSIVAKTAGQAPESQVRLMLQTLLADRFKLALHRETRDIRVLALIVDKNGPRFHESQDEGESQQQPTSKLARKWTRFTMAQFAASLGEAMQSPVQDHTGLAARYDFSLDLTPYLTPGERPDIAAMMVTAVREQLGLRLEPRRAATDVLVIDHLEKPTEN